MEKQNSYSFYKSQGGKEKVIRYSQESSSPEFVAGIKKLNLDMKFEPEGTLSAHEDEDGVVEIQISGPKGTIQFGDFLQEYVDNPNFTDGIQIVTPNFILSRFRDYLNLPANAYAKESVESGRPSIIPFSRNPGSERFSGGFLICNEPSSPKYWILTLLHEGGHAKEIAEISVGSLQGGLNQSPAEKSRIERQGWADALRLSKIIKDKTEVDLLSVFSSQKEISDFVSSMLLAYRASYVDLGQRDIADSLALFDKGKLKRVKK